MQMKSILFLLVFATSIISCKEVLEVYKPTAVSAKDSSFVSAVIESPQLKNVLIEEYTGVKCQNCPTGHKIVADIQAANPERVLSIRLHSSLQSSVYPYSTQDLFTDEAEALHQRFQISSKPSAVIDRVPFNGVLQLGRTNWTPAVTERLKKTSPVNIHIENSYNADSLKLETKVKLHFTDDVTDKLNFSVFLIENNIVTPQTLPSFDTDTFYNHQHVFRKMIGGSTDGISINDSTTKGRTIVKYFYTYFKSIYKPENMKTVVAVSKSGSDNEVIHCEEGSVKK